MSSSSDATIQVKDEPVSEDVFNAETDSETDEDIEVDKLQPLDPKFASLTKFPIGCKVWYDLCKSTQPTKCLRAKSAFIEEAFIHFENRKQAYKVKSEITEYESTLYEDRLVYGANCPVIVTCPDTNEVRNGVIICPKLDKGGDGDGDGKERVSYAVQFWQGKQVYVEYGVAAESVKYRMEEEKTSREGCRTACNPDSDDAPKNVSGTRSTEAPQSAGKATEEEGEVVETNATNENESLTDENERPKKVAKISHEKAHRCVLFIPEWLEDRRGLFCKCSFIFWLFPVSPYLICLSYQSSSYWR